MPTPSGYTLWEFEQLEWIPVSSSNLEYVAYAPALSRLWVWFRRQPGSGAKHSVYLYHYVPQKVYDGLMAAGSHGSYFASRIKNVYGYEPVA